MASVVFNSTTEQVWLALRSAGLSKNGAAGMMGNMFAESGVTPARIQGDHAAGYTRSKEYTQKVDKKQISEYQFVHNGPGGGGYGLCQWTSPGRKQNLYNLTVKQGRSISDIQGQVSLVVSELKTIKYRNHDKNVSAATVWDVVKEGTNYSVAVCSNAILLDFERPASGSSKKGTRAGYSQQYYNKYNGIVGRRSFNSSEVNNLNNLVDIALSQEGTRETGYNNVKYNTWYYGHAVNSSGAHWCMVFVQWCCHEAGIAVPRTASCSSFLHSSAVQDCFVERDSLQRGDIIFFTNTSVGSIQSARNAKRAAHVGIVVSNNGDGTITTIEGNTGNPNGRGEGVFKKTRYLSKPYLDSGGGIVCGIRLGVVNEEGGSTDTISSSTRWAWIQNVLDTYQQTLQDMFASIVPFENYKVGSSIKANEYEYKEFTTKVTRDEIVSANIDPNAIRTRGTSLLTTPTLVESPFILLKVGDYTFGSYSKNGNFNSLGSKVIVDYPNYMNSINIVKINGVVNQYTIQMIYQIQAGQDPNLIDRIFSSVGYGTVYISYGDWNYPAYIYKTEEAIITNLSSNVDFTNSRINYTLKCTSNSISLMGGYYNFTATESKPSDVLYNMLYSKNSTYKLLDTFPGMKNQTLVRSKGLLRSDDIIVKIEAKSGMDALSYINYLVSCMSDSKSKYSTGLRTSNYYLTICDDTTGEFGGSYFKISKVSSDNNTVSLNNSNIYEVDIGYPSDTLVTNFKLNTDNSWALLYNYSNSISSEIYTYNIDNQGNVIQTSSPSALMSSKYGRTTETQLNWWTQMTQFPITATLEIKGLVKPALLMTYLRINALFYGQRHTSSGLYVITKQEDQVDERGYRTILSLTRIAGDLDTIQHTTRDVTVKVPVMTSKVVGGTTIDKDGFSGRSGNF